MKLTAQDVMTQSVVTVSPETRVEEAAAQMAHYHLTGLPVLDPGGSVVGLVSEFDLIGKQGRVVSDIMTRQVISISPDTDLEEVGFILTGRHIGRLPVVQAGKLVGVVSRRDLIKRIATRWTCDVCNSFERGKEPPAHCPTCGAEASHFTLDEEPPMMFRDI